MSRKISIPQLQPRRLALLPLLCAATAVASLPAFAGGTDSTITGSIVDDPGTPTAPTPAPPPPPKADDAARKQAEADAKAAQQAADAARKQAEADAKAAQQAAQQAADAARKQAAADAKAARAMLRPATNDDSSGTGRKIG